MNNSEFNQYQSDQLQQLSVAPFNLLSTTLSDGVHEDDCASTLFGDDSQSASSNQSFICSAQSQMTNSILTPPESTTSEKLQFDLQSKVAVNRFEVIVHTQQAFPSRNSELGVVQGKLFYANKGQALTVTLRDTDYQNECVRSLIYVDIADKEELTSQDAWITCMKQYTDEDAFLPIIATLNKPSFINSASNALIVNQPLQVEIKMKRYFMIEWNGQSSVDITFNFLSTDFSSNKGVRGIISTLNVITYSSKFFESQIVSFKVFRDKGADRKYREESARARKQGSFDKYHKNDHVQLKLIENAFMNSDAIEQKVLQIMSQCVIIQEETQLLKVQDDNKIGYFDQNHQLEDDEILVVRKKQRFSQNSFYFKVKEDQRLNMAIEDVLESSGYHFVAMIEPHSRKNFYHQCNFDIDQSNSYKQQLTCFLNDNILESTHDVSLIFKYLENKNICVYVTETDFVLWAKNECALSAHIILLDDLTIAVIIYE